LHEPVREHHALVPPRRLLACLPEAPSRVEPGVRAGARAWRGEHGRSRPPPRRNRGASDRRLAPAVTRTADVVIVGGGVTGASIAYHLAQRGVRKILVLERKFLGAGGTGRSVGIVRQLYPTPETTQMVLRSEEHTSELQSPDHLVCRLLLEKK